MFAILRKTCENGEKPNLNLGHHIFLKKNPASLVTRYHVHLLSCTISEKTNDPILRKLSDGQANRQGDESDFIGRCPTKKECIMQYAKKKLTY